MKRITILIASMLMFFSLKTNAQNDRVLLLESFTNTSCGYCAMFNPDMDALINANADKIAAIKYHVSWPSNQDPMYQHNISDNNSRTNYYGVANIGVPYVVVDGTHFLGGPDELSQNKINQLLSIESPIEMRLAYNVDEEANTITVNVIGRTSTAISGNLKLYVGVIEKAIHFNTAPGNNGERNFYSVMKKLLPSASGMAVSDMEANDYFAYAFTWNLENIYDIDQLDAIAWLQNGNTKEVYQACKSSENPMGFLSNEAGLSEISHVKAINCSGLASPKVVMTNYGINPLTSSELEVFVNGASVKTIHWNGHLNAFDKETIDLGEISFPVESQNTLEVKINNINGGADEDSMNDIATLNIKGAPDIVGKVLKLTIRTDNNPQETSWKVTNLTTGEVVLEGGPYEQANHNYTETLNITGDGCFDFTIYDAGGDGFSSGGIYGLKAGATTLFSGMNFSYSESNEFSYEVTEGTEEMLVATTSIYPNPTTGMVNIVNESEQAVTIYNMAGQRVYAGVSNGYLQIDMKAYGTGIYAIQVGNETQRVVVK